MAASRPRVRGSIRLLCAAACALALAWSPAALANQGVDAGNDYFQSLPGTEVDLSSLGLGVIPLEGVPFGGCLGDADTIVRRIDPVPLAGDTIDIELIALELKSVDPVDLTPLGGPFVGVFADLYTTVNVGGQTPGVPQYDPLLPSTGRMEIRHENAQGGTFDSCLGDTGDPGICGTLGLPGGGVYADAIFTVLGGDPGNPLDVLFSQPAPRISVNSLLSDWVHDDQPPPGSGGPPGVCPPAGGQPRNSKVTGISENGPHPVQPVFFLAVPALGGWALRIAVVLIAVLGGLSIAAYRGILQRRV